MGFAEERLAILAGLCPALLIFLFFDVRSHGEIAWAVSWSAFAWGMVAVALVFPIELLLWLRIDSIDAPYLYGGLRAGIAGATEETTKWLIFLGFCRREEVGREAQSVMIAVAVATGFAAIENACYLAFNRQWPEIAWLRASSAVPMHALCGLAMGLVGFQALRRPGGGALWWLGALAIPIILHTLYDAPLMILSALALGRTVVNGTAIGAGSLMLELVLAAAAVPLVWSAPPGPDRVGESDRWYLRRPRRVVLGLFCGGGVLVLLGTVLALLGLAQVFFHGPAITMGGGSRLPLTPFAIAPLFFGTAALMQGITLRRQVAA
jgi:RsiW-degrading membrane proteinase PrsW (M82 family)